MGSKLSVLTVAVSLAVVAASLSADAATGVGSNPAYVCSFCQLVLGLVEESAFQLHLLPHLEEKCSSDGCKRALDHLVLRIEGKNTPDETCRAVEMCTDECVAFTSWPVNPLPPKVESHDCNALYPYLKLLK